MGRRCLCSLLACWYLGLPDKLAMQLWCFPISQRNHPWLMHDNEEKTMSPKLVLLKLDQVRAHPEGFPQFPTHPLCERLPRPQPVAILPGVAECHPNISSYRSEERRVGKECRSRW